MNTSSVVTSLFKYKAWANDQILAAMKKFDEKVHGTERHNALRILNHTYVVDRIFAANLQRLNHEYTATNTVDTPTLEQLAAGVAASDRWYVEYVGNLGPSELSESIDFTFTDGAPGRMSREEMLMHVVLHGGYHRGGIGRIMAPLSISPPRDVFTGYLHVAEPAARRRVENAEKSL
ncbi:MAG: DinB family protein [Steroidobacteraceae bacterium]